MATIAGSRGILRKTISFLLAVVAVGCSEVTGLPAVSGEASFLDRWATPEELDDFWFALGNINRNDPDCAAIFNNLDAMLSDTTNHFKIYTSSESTDPGYFVGSTNSHVDSYDRIGFNELDIGGAYGFENAMATLIHEGAHAAGWTSNEDAEYFAYACQISVM